MAFLWDDDERGPCGVPGGGGAPEIPPPITAGSIAKELAEDEHLRIVFRPAHWPREMYCDHDFERPWTVQRRS